MENKINLKENARLKKQIIILIIVGIFFIAIVSVAGYLIWYVQNHQFGVMQNVLETTIFDFFR